MEKQKFLVGQRITVKMRGKTEKIGIVMHYTAQPFDHTVKLHDGTTASFADENVRPLPNGQL